jgi:hypothetical protein
MQCDIRCFPIVSQYIASTPVAQQTTNLLQAHPFQPFAIIHLPLQLLDDWTPQKPSCFLRLRLCGCLQGLVCTSSIAASSGRPRVCFPLVVNASIVSKSNPVQKEC